MGDNSLESFRRIAIKFAVTASTLLCIAGAGTQNVLAQLTGYNLPGRTPPTPLLAESHVLEAFETPENYPTLIWERQLPDGTSGEDVEMLANSDILGSATVIIERDPNGRSYAVLQGPNGNTDLMRANEISLGMPPEDTEPYRVQTMGVDGTQSIFWGKVGGVVLWQVGRGIGTQQHNPSIAFCSNPEDPAEYPGDRHMVTYLVDLQDGSIQPTVSFRAEFLEEFKEIEIAIQDFLETGGLDNHKHYLDPDHNIKDALVSHLRQYQIVDTNTVELIEQGIAEIYYKDGQILLVSQDGFYWNANPIIPFLSRELAELGSGSLLANTPEGLMTLPYVTAVITDAYGNERAVLMQVEKFDWEEKRVDKWGLPSYLNPPNTEGHSLLRTFLGPDAELTDSTIIEKEIAATGMGTYFASVHISTRDGADTVHLNLIHKTDRGWVGPSEDLFGPGTYSGTTIVSTNNKVLFENTMAVAVISHQTPDNPSNAVKGFVQVGVDQDGQGIRMPFDIPFYGDPSLAKIDMSISSDGKQLLITVVDDNGRRIRIFEQEIKINQNFLPLVPLGTAVQYLTDQRTGMPF